MRKSLLLVGLLIVLAIGVVFFSQSSILVPTVHRSTVTIGAALALTGDAAAWGEAEKNGITLALEEIGARSNTPKIEVKLEDTRSTSADTVLASSKLINIDHVSAIIGPTWIDSYAGAAPLSDQHSILMLTPSAAITGVKTDRAYRNVFSTWYDADTNAKALAEWIKRGGSHRIAIVSEQDAYWQDIVMRLRAAAPGASLEIVSTEETARGATDFRTTLAKLKQNPPDAMIFGFLSEQAVHSFLKQRHELGLNVPAYSNESIVDFLLKDDFRGLVDSVYSVVPSVNDQSFAVNYKRRFGVEPVFSASNAYDATKILVQAMQQGTSTEQIRESLKKQTFQTATFGEVRFEDNGAIKIGTFVLKSVKDGRMMEQK